MIDTNLHTQELLMKLTCTLAKNQMLEAVLYRENKSLNSKIESLDPKIESQGCAIHYHPNI